MEVNKRQKNIILIVNMIFLFFITGCNDKKEMNTKISNAIDNYSAFRIDTPMKDENCVAVSLDLYKNGKYEFFKAYKKEIQSHLDTPFYVYTKSDKGRYSYDLFKIIDGLSKYDGVSENYKYIITVDNDEKYVIMEGQSNKYLDELLNEIDVNLDICAQEDESD